MSNKSSRDGVSQVKTGKKSKKILGVHHWR
jgi:hypothetical protein